jgi:hypothetical protein
MVKRWRRIMAKRTGLRNISKKVDKGISELFKEFAKWLRREYEFPLRVPIYLSEKSGIINITGESCVSAFFAPFDEVVEPYARIDTGDYYDMVRESDSKNSTLNLLYSLALAVVNYQKWLSDNKGFDNYDGDEYATNLIFQYIKEGF